jgi:hypothetical protein
MLTVPALFAAALERSIGSLYLAGGLISFRNLADTEDYSHPMSNFIPNLLRHTDLPETAAAIAPRKLVLAGMVNGAGRPMDAAAVRAVYPGSHVEVNEQARWTADALMQSH